MLASGPNARTGRRDVDSLLPGNTLQSQRESAARPVRLAGLGRQVLILVTGVQIPYGTLFVRPAEPPEASCSAVSRIVASTPG